MCNFLELLPEHVLDKLVHMWMDVHPWLKVTFLSSLGSRIHRSAVRVLFRTLEIEDDYRSFTISLHKSVVYPLLSSPKRYAQVVQTLTIRDPVDFLASDSGQRRPLDAENLSRLLEVCSNLEDLSWESALPPPDGICEKFVSYCPRLKRFSYDPRYIQCPLRHANLAKWHAPSLPLLSSLNITSLSLSCLSQAGARALSDMLFSLGDDALEDLSVDFVWLDDSLCEAIAAAGQKLRRLRLCTTGTKLSDKGIVTILETCDALEEFNLDEVQGRLSRLVWTKPLMFPTSLRCLRIDVSESGPHHSWALDHLDSLHAFPLELLTDLRIVRREALPNIRDATITASFHVDDVASLRPLPLMLGERLRDCKSLINFHCDFWAFSVADIKLLLGNCHHLQTLKICLDIPFLKLLSLTSIFAPLSNLRIISACIAPAHAPGTPPTPLLPNASSTASAYPDSFTSKSKLVLPHLLDFDQMQTQTCLTKETGDVSMPSLRDVKRFVRKCPKLELLEWYGKSGRGSWVVKRPATVSKTSFNVTVEYFPPRLSMSVWRQMSRADKVQEALDRGCSWFNETRMGQEWAGEQAELLFSEKLAAERENETESTLKAARRTRGRKFRVPSISSSSSNSDPNYPPTPSRTSASPVDMYLPLTSPSSDRAGSYGLPSDTQQGFWDSPEGNGRKRSPSEPIFAQEKHSQRTRSATNVWTDYSAVTAFNNTGVRGSGRGRGRGRGRGTKKAGNDGYRKTDTDTENNRGRSMVHQATSRHVRGRGDNNNGETRCSE